MSRGIPYFNFYPSDFMHGVRGLTAQEVGIYTMVLCRIYEENGPVAYHAARLAAYCGCKEKVLASTVERLVDLGKLSLRDGLLSNARAEAEIEHRNRAVKNSSQAGKVSAEKRQQNQRQTSTTVQRTVNHTDTDISKSSVSSDKSSETGVVTPPDPVKVMFDSGVRLLAQAGISATRARPIIGKWRSAHGEEAVIVALGKAQREGAIDPVSFIEGCFRQEKKKVEQHDFWTGPKLN